MMNNPEQTTSQEEESVENQELKFEHYVSIEKDINKDSSPRFCCMAHEALYAEDFQSDEEDIGFVLEKSPVNDIYFYDRIPEGIKREMAQMKNRNEIATQCDTDTPVSLAYISALPAYGNPDDKILSARYQPCSLSHIPVMYLPSELPDLPDDDIQHTFLCKCCKKEFKSGQALGGHVSRAHPGFVEEQARKLREASNQR
ncbi:unnamed protein product [Blepharisma stoltei]|uniref:C2H2-type domain-containing protein n=1 Tax=Blepharisma stoltei TaxID=1481888 RepID=A0AAU9JU67_9CILI|nr:unnamed protein product [Blepharisma stoltei]